MCYNEENERWEELKEEQVPVEVEEKVDIEECYEDDNGECHQGHA